VSYSPPASRAPDLGDLVVVLLVNEGFDGAAELVADLVEAADDYLAGLT
jgi:hypothetical protein